MNTKQARHDVELAVFASRHDGSAHALRDWLYIRRDEINSSWYAAFGDDLIRLQGEAKLISRLIKLIEQGPSIQPERKAP